MRQTLSGRCAAPAQAALDRAGDGSSRHPL